MRYAGCVCVCVWGGGGGEGWGGDIAIQKREFDYIKIKIVPFIIKFGGNVPFDMHRFKSKKGASVSEEFALLNWSSLGCMRCTWFTIWSKQILSIFKKNHQGILKLNLKPQ